MQKTTNYIAMPKFLIPILILILQYPCVIQAQETFIRYISFQENSSLPDLAGKRSMESVLEICRTRENVQVELLGSPANDLGRQQFTFVEKRIRAVSNSEFNKGKSWTAAQVNQPGLVGIRMVVPPQPQLQYVRVKSNTEVEKMLEKMAPKPQTYTFDPSEKQEIVLKSGSRIYIPENSFALKKETETVQLEVVEYQSPGEMITGGLPTMTKDELLVTGGSMRVEVRADGVPVNLKEDHQAKVFFAMEEKPKGDAKDEVMQLYQGNVDADGRLVWEKPGGNSPIRVLEPGMSLRDIPVEPLVKPEGPFRDIYRGGELTPKFAINGEGNGGSRAGRRFGFAFPLRLSYINCDHGPSFWMPRRRIKRPVIVKMKVNVPTPETHQCYARLHDTKTVAFGFSPKEGKMPEFNLPKDKRVTIITVKIEEGEPWLAMAVTKASNKTIDNLVWKKTTESRLREVLGELEW